MNERVVHIMNVARMTPNVNERTGETFKTAQVLKDVYNGINKNKMSVRFKKKKKKKDYVKLCQTVLIDILCNTYSEKEPDLLTNRHI